MKARTILLMVGLVTCLFSTSFAKQDDNSFVQQGPVNMADPGLRMDPQGAPTSDMVWCNPCGGWVRKDVALLAKTAKARSAGNKASSVEGASAGQQ